MRRFAVTALTVFLGTFPPGSGAPLSAQDVAQFRGDPARTGVHPASGFETPAAVAWRACVGSAVRSAPAVTDGVAYLGTGAGHVVALVAATGEELWRADVGAEVSSSPAVGGGLVVVQARDGRVVALHAADGTEAWSLATGAPRVMPWGEEGWDYWVSSPALLGDGRVLVASADGVLRLLAARSGEPLAEIPLGTRLRSSPAWADGVAYVGGSDGAVYAVDVGEKRVLWRHETVGAGLDSRSFGFDRRTVQSSPAVVDGRVVIGSRDGGLYALDAATGERLWRVDHGMAWVVASPVVADGVVWVGTSDAHSVEAVDLATGEVLWETKVGSRVLGSPVVAGGVVLAPLEGGFLAALDAAGGELLWRVGAGAPVRSAPTAAGATAWFGDDAGFVRAVRAGGGEPGTRLAVVWDSVSAELAFRAGGELVRDDLARHGFEVVDGPGAARFAAAVAERPGPAVLVFATDHLPDGLAPGEAGSPSPLVRYLEAGGRVVWLGLPPGALVRDSTGRPVALEPERSTPVTRTDFAGALFDEHGAVPTPEGRRRGLRAPAVGTLALPPGRVDEVLAVDGTGRAAAWVRRFPGDRSSGARGRPGEWVHLWGLDVTPERLPEIRAVATHGVLRDPAGRFDAGCEAAGAG